MTSQVKPYRNRASYAFLFGLLAAAGVALSADGWGRSMIGGAPAALHDLGAPRFTPVSPRPLSAQDQEAARIAWRYFEQNTRDETGLVDSVSGFASGTLWDQGSYLFALLSAEALGLIDRAEFEYRAQRLLDSLAELPLFQGRLPNKAYDTTTLQMVGYDNAVSDQGIGWSALDIARMLTALRVLERRAPQFGSDLRALLALWDLNAMAKGGVLIGATWEQGQVVHVQEGRIGYEQYAARAAAMWGLDVSGAMSAARIVDWARVARTQVPIDRRSHSVFRAITPTLSEPYLLLGLEMGLDSEAQMLASQVYEAQWRRYRQSGAATMVSEDHINQAPHFLYSSVHSNGAPWAVVSEAGEDYPELRTVSLKAVYGWDALYDTVYTAQLRAELQPLASPGGWLAGRFEATGAPNDVLTLNTNAVVLEAVHYMAFGPLWAIK